jgi:pteridine reductase
MLKLDGSVVLITGAGRRIGKALALAVARHGAAVAVHCNQSVSEAQAVISEIREGGGVAHGVCGDLTHPDECERIVAESYAAFGHLDVLVNNAAIFFKTPLPDVTEEDWDRTLDLNLKGSFFCAQAAAARMQERGGKIINVADWSGVRPYQDYLPYCISKAGVIAMTRGLARTLAPKIAVNAIAPGPVLLPADFDTEERETIIRHTPLQRLGTPDDIVNAVLFLIKGTDFMTGATLMIDGGRLIA